MRTAYRVLAFLIAAEVVVQAAVMAFAVAGMGRWVQQGGVLDKATMESEEEFPFPEVVGFIVHGMNGYMVIPLLALILLVVSFFAKVPKGPIFAAGVLGLVVLQILLGVFSRGAEIPFLGLLHGANALVLFTVAVLAAGRARRRTPVPDTRSMADERAAV